MFKTLNVDGKTYKYLPISDIEGVDALPFSLKILLENVLRCATCEKDGRKMANNIVSAALDGISAEEVSFTPARVLLQDFTGVPAFVDYASMREACASLGGNAEDIEPRIPCNLVIDHSVIADFAGSTSALEENMRLEYEKNAERYEFLKWAQGSFENVSVTEPGKGICHQLNIEQIADVVAVKEIDGQPIAFFDTLVGTDSHTPTANGLGVLGWGVGGIEAEAASLGQPITILVPKVVGIRMTGSLRPNITAMDVALTLAETLRKTGVVGCFVECFGEGLASLSATQRACISNMSPEYGCTATLFPVDEQTLSFLRLSGREESHVRLVEEYCRSQGFLYEAGCGDAVRKYSQIIDFDLSSVESSLAGPTRPHDRLNFSELSSYAHKTLSEATATYEFKTQDDSFEMRNGTIAIAAITSCTTATDPAMMIQAGIVARNAANLGARVKPWVKAIFAPGSHSTTKLLERAGLLDYLSQIGFHVCGYGCMSCIGNSGPLSEQMHEAASKIELASVLSGNRNFEGRISPDVSQNYLMNPANVVLMAIAGSIDFDLDTDAIAQAENASPIRSLDLLPKPGEIEQILKECLDSSIYREARADMATQDERWDGLKSKTGLLYSWDDDSTYVRRPTFFDEMDEECNTPSIINGAYVLAKLGDFITTDHISPAGAILPGSPAANYLEEHGVQTLDFNTYGSRRGNHEIMMRGTFGNVKLENELAKGKLGGFTYDALSDEVTTIYDAAMHYKASGVPAIVIAGKMYGSGSSRDWAAKGPALLGVRAVIAESFERIHRSNLIGMGILPLQFKDGQNADTLGLDGTERYDISEVLINQDGQAEGLVHVTAKRSDESIVTFDAIVRIDTPTEGKYYANGGILQYVLRNILHMC